MNKIIFSITFLLASVLSHGSANNIPLVMEFKVKEEKVFTHLSSIFESAMQMAIEGNHLSELSSQNGNNQDSNVMMTKVIKNFLHFDVSSMDQSLLDSNPDNFQKNVVDLFRDYCMKDVDFAKIQIDSEEPNFEEIELKLKSFMAGYYLAILKDSNYNMETVQIDWRFQEIQIQIGTEIKSILQNLANQVKTIQVNLTTRYNTFKELFNVSQSQIHIVVYSFRSLAFELLLNQVRTFYLNLAVDKNATDLPEIKQNPLETFKRTVEMFSIAKKLCENECSSESYEVFVPSILEELVQLRVQNNSTIVSNQIVNTFYSKFLGFLLQTHFDDNMEGQDADLATEQYSMFIYRMFLSRNQRYLNKKTTEFMQAMYKEHELNFLHPVNEDNEAVTELKQKMNNYYVFDLILYLDFPEIDEQVERTLDTERTQEISFSCDDVETLVQRAAEIFWTDLDTLTSEQLIINWFTGLNMEEETRNYDDYVSTYKYLMNFRTEEINRDVHVGISLSKWLDQVIRGDLVLIDENKDYDFSDKYMLMKVINMINVLYGVEFIETFEGNFDEMKKLKIINFFRRISKRREFNVLRSSLLLIFAHYNSNENGEITQADLVDDKFMYDLYDNQEIECVKLPEILKTEIKMSSITITEEKNEIKGDVPIPAIINKSVKSNDTNSKVETSSIVSSEVFEDTSSSKKSEDYRIPIRKDEVLNKSKKSDIDEDPSDIYSESIDSSTNSEVENMSPINKNDDVVVVKKDSVRSSEVIESESIKTSQVSEVSPIKKIDNPAHIVIKNDSVRSSEVVESESIKTHESSKVIEDESPITKNDDVVVVKKDSVRSSEEIVSENSKTSQKSEISPIKKIDNPAHIIITNNSVRSSEDIESHSIKTHDSSNTSEVSAIKKIDNPAHIVIKNDSVRSSEEIESHSIKTHDSSKISEVSAIKKIDNPAHIVIKNDSVRSSEEIESHSIKTHDSSKISEVSPIKKIDNPAHIVVTNNSVRSSEDIESHSIKTHESSKNNSPQNIPKVIITEPSSRQDEIQKDNKSEKSVDSDSDSNKSENKNIRSPKISTKTWHEPESSENSSSVDTSENSTLDINKKRSGSHPSQVDSYKSFDEKSDKTENNGLIVNPVENRSEDSSQYSELEVNSSETSDKVVTHDEENQKKNLVYEVVGKLTPTQKKTLEFSNNVFADIKNTQITVDEFGNEVEYVYVQIVRKDSDCYEELMKYK